MRKYFDADQGVEIKADTSVVTIADKLINSMVIERLAKAFPEDGVIGEEESNAEYGGGRKWICDPIDGTSGYTWGTPTSMFSLAFVVDGVPAVGVAYDPFLDKMYTGIKGMPSQCNGKDIHVSNLSMKEGIIAVTGSIGHFTSQPFFKKVVEKSRKIAIYSGAVHKSCLIARGKLVGDIQNTVHPHDVAAIHVIVEGAGGKITSPSGKKLDYTKPFKGAVISNGVAHEELLGYLK